MSIKLISSSVVFQALSISFSFLVSLSDSFLVPKLIFEELSKLALDFDHDMHLLFLEAQRGVQLLWVIWEVDTVLEVYFIKPFLEVVLEESEG